MRRAVEKTSCDLQVCLKNKIWDGRFLADLCIPLLLCLYNLSTQTLQQWLNLVSNSHKLSNLGLVWGSTGWGSRRTDRIILCSRRLQRNLMKHRLLSSEFLWVLKLKKLLRNQYVPNAPGKKTPVDTNKVAALLQMMETAVMGETNYTYELHMFFFQRTQKDSETFDQYLTKLTEKIKYCDICEYMHGRLIKAHCQLTLGMPDATLQKKANRTTKEESRGNKVISKCLCLYTKEGTKLNRQQFHRINRSSKSILTEQQGEVWFTQRLYQSR